jgi:hypothetical protein
VRRPGGSHVFLAAVAVVAGGLVAGSILVASREWFVGDDFFFLHLARQPRSLHDWLDTFLPFGPRAWWSYRPLSADAFFYAGLRVFGFDATPYLLFSLFVHFISGAILCRIALQLGFDLRVALVSAIVSVSRYPSLDDVFWVSAFQHVGAKFFYLLTVWLFLKYIRSGRRWQQWTSCCALVLTLLCNEFGASACLVLLFFSLDDGRKVWSFPFTRQRICGVGPHFAITAVYLLLRLKLFGAAAMTMPVYRVEFGHHIATNYVRYLRYVLGGSAAGLMIAVVLVLGGLVLLAARDVWRLRFRWLLGIALVCSGWIVVAVAPFVAMPWSHPRLAMIIEPPVCLLFGAYLNACWALWGKRWPRVGEIVLIALLVAAMPYQQLQERAREPRGAGNRQLAELVQQRSGAGSGAICVIVFYGTVGLGSTEDLQTFRWRTWDGSMLTPLYPNRKATLVTHDARSPLPADLRSRQCIHALLKPGGSIEAATPLVTE